MSAASSVSTAQQRILTALSLAGQEAVLFATLQRDLSLDQRTAAEALRGLMETGRVLLRRGNTDGSVYVALAHTMPEGASLVLDAIRASGNGGLDQPTLCGKVRLPKGEILKALQLLLAQKRIKERRCFSNRAKRIYLLFEFEPSEEVTGGTFYGGEDAREMDVWFIDEMRRRVVALVAQRRSVSLAEITQHLQEAHGAQKTTRVLTLHPGGSACGPGSTAGGSHVNPMSKRVSARDAQVLAQTLLLDGVLDCVAPPDGSPPQYQLAIGRNVLRHFTAAPGTDGTQWAHATLATGNAWAMPAVGVPCLGCPQLPVCSANGTGVVNPRNCAYLNEWLS